MPRRNRRTRTTTARRVRAEGETAGDRIARILRAHDRFLDSLSRGGSGGPPDTAPRCQLQETHDPPRP